MLCMYGKNSTAPKWPDFHISGLKKTRCTQSKGFDFNCLHSPPKKVPKAVRAPRTSFLLPPLQRLTSVVRGSGSLPPGP